MRTYKLFILPLAIIGLTCGCGGDSTGPERFPATGTVTLDGSPLETGEIVFDPIDGAGQSAAGAITNGQFEVDACVGNMKVSITASRESSELDEYGEVIVESILPPNKYDIDSQLTAEVTEEGPNAFEFELTSD